MRCQWLRMLWALWRILGPPRITSLWLSRFLFHDPVTLPLCPSGSVIVQNIVAWFLWGHKAQLAIPLWPGTRSRPRSGRARGGRGAARLASAAAGASRRRSSGGRRVLRAGRVARSCAPRAGGRTAARVARRRPPAASSRGRRSRVSRGGPRDRPVFSPPTRPSGVSAPWHHVRRRRSRRAKAQSALGTARRPRAARAAPHPTLQGVGIPGGSGRRPSAV